MVEKNPGRKESLPSKIERVKIAYNSFEKEVNNERYETGIGYNDREGRIGLEARVEIAHKISDLTQSLPPDELPTTVFLEDGHEGRLMGSVIAGDLATFEVLMSRPSKYFMPRTYELYHVDLNLGPEYIPDNGNFVGIDNARTKEQGVNINSAKLTIPLETIKKEGKIQETGQFSEEEAEKILDAYSKSVRSKEGKEILSRFKEEIEAIKANREQSLKDAISSYSSVLKTRLHNLIKSIEGDFVGFMPAYFFLSYYYEKGKEPENSDRVYFSIKDRKFLVVPLRKVEVLGKTIFRMEDFKKSREATDPEFLDFVSYAGYRLLNFLPPKLKEQILS